MKKFVFGLILMLCTLSALPTQAHAPDDGVKKEVKQLDVAPSVFVVDFSIDVPQVLFDNHSVLAHVDNWNTIFVKEAMQKTNFEIQSFSFRNDNTILNFYPLLHFNSKYIHVDPGSKI